jgi:two-component system sensor histidine kinase KdpD
MTQQVSLSGSEVDSGRLPWFAPSLRAPKRSLSGFRGRLKPYLLALVCVALSTLVALLIDPFSSLEDEAMIYLLGDIVAALRFDTKVSIFTAIGSVVACDFLFVQPRMTFAWTDTRKSLTFLAMIVVAVVVSGLSARLRQQEKVARHAAAATRELYELNLDLANHGEPQQLAQATRRRLERVTGADVSIALRGAEAELLLTPPPAPGSEQGLLVAAFARELGAALERAQLAGAAQRAELEAETERMRSSLLSVVSHDLKTPLAGIVASGSMLLEHEGTLDAKASRVLMATLVRECERLARLLQNLLSMSRLESSKLELRRSPELVEDIVASALERLSSVLAPRRVELDLPMDLPCIFVEPALLEQVLLNLLENAVRYTPPGSRIELSARAAGGMVQLEVADSGPGIHERERERVFHEFFRGSRAKKGDGGIGLGLPICRAIVRAHGGQISIRDRVGGGTVVALSVPAQPLVMSCSTKSLEVSA